MYNYILRFIHKRSVIFVFLSIHAKCEFVKEV